MDLVLEKGVFFQGEEERRAGPFNYQTPQALKGLLNLSLAETGTSNEKLFGILASVIKYSPHPSHPFMLDKRVAGLDPYALAADWLAATMSNLVVTYQISPVWTLMELEMTKKLSALIGWEVEGDGVPTAGGGVANCMAISLALQAKFPDFKYQGLFGRERVPVIFYSQHATYGVEKARAYQGFGKNQLVSIKADGNGRMDVEDLKLKIDMYGANPENQLVMVFATAGERE
jgi:glutamate/tyrosine decarboxylase-like PLP-dependent enzyme